MKMRFIMNIAVLISLSLVSVPLLLNEFVPKEVIEVKRKNIDTLRDITYTSIDRKENLSSFGLSPEQVALAIKKIERYEEKYKVPIRKKLSSTSEAEQVVEAFCGQVGTIRPRYAAVNFLVMEKNGRRLPVDIRRLKRIERQEWSLAMNVELFYKDLELVPDPKPDSTKMFVAAILSSKEDLLLDRISPWGKGSSWKWKGVVRENKGIEDKVVDYFAILHLFVEIAQSSDGICEYTQ